MTNLTNNETQEIIQKIVHDKGSFLNTDVKTFLVDGMSELLNKAFLREREFYLSSNTADKANGFSPRRNVSFGTSSIPISVPRSRSGRFYPALLGKYKRIIGVDHLDLIESIILGSKSFKSASDAIRSMGLSYSNEQIEALLSDLHDEAKKYNQRQLATDFCFVFIDAKVIDMADEARHIKCAVHFVAIGVTMECKKELLLSESFFGHESLDLWRKVIQSLKNRGLTRVMTVITDDFSGLNKIVASLLPGCDHQLCLVHLMRNVRKNLDRKMYEDFSALIQKIYLCSSYDDAYSKFAEFVRNEVGSRDKKYANYLMERADNYLTFMKYPSALRPVIRSTNAVEGINNAIEIARRAAGGYFHSERELAVKLKIIFDSLKKEKWGIPIPRFAANLSEINRMFYERFEGEGMRVR